jgi:hypothetical protein
MTARADDAIDFVAGGIDPRARRALGQDLLLDPAFAAAVGRLEQALGPLAADGPDVPPPEGLLEAIEARLDAEARIAGYATDVRVDSEGWRELAPGCWRKDLWDERAYLLRFDPGTARPPHLHPTTEHCVVIAGSMLIDGVAYGPGDYHAPMPGSRHGILSSPEGLLVFVRRGE